jgi:metal-responsive CopG/Arc/MetJ family transcriptional regulator
MSRIKQYERTIGVPMEQQMYEQLEALSQRLGGIPLSNVVRSMVQSALTASGGAEAMRLPWEASN